MLFVNSGDPWNPLPKTVTKVMAMLEGVHRVLKPDGIFISISFGQVSQIKFIASSFNICTVGKIILLARVTCIQRMISCVVQCTYICCIENFLERKKNSNMELVSDAASLQAAFLQCSEVYLVIWTCHLWWWISLFFLYLEEGKCTKCWSFNRFW